jgi:uncharacterized protein YecT (DUF1311 family)
MSDEADQPEELGPLASTTADGEAHAGEPAADMPPLQPASEAPARRRIPITMIGAVAAAGLVGITVGLALAPGVRTPAPTAPPADQMQVLVETKPDPTPAVGPPMPTLQGLPPAAPAAARPAVTPPPVAPPPVAAPVSSRPPPADMACAYAAADPASGCGDPDLIEADRELYAAYQAARRAGLPPRDLRADQENWRDAGADAAGQSRAALLGAYRERTEAVWAMIDEWDRRGQNDDPRLGRPRFR